MVRTSIAAFMISCLNPSLRKLDSSCIQTIASGLVMAARPCLKFVKVSIQNPLKAHSNTTVVNHKIEGQDKFVEY